jgi:hypothetical protein
LRPRQWIALAALLIAYFGWLGAVLALGPDRPLDGILLGFIPGVLLIHVAAWLLPRCIAKSRARGPQ